jgi:DNA-binding GntR family transcriptional regulator
MHDQGTTLPGVRGSNGKSATLGTNSNRIGELRRDTLFSQIYDELCAGLSAGRFQPGESVTLRQLADDFGTSIMPVREAVSRLISERALRMLPNRKVIVPEMTRERFQDLAHFRQLIEPVAAELAAERLQDAQIAALDVINKGLLAALADGDVGGALAANRDFHMGIYRAAGSDALLQAIVNAWLQVGPFLYLSMTSNEVPWTTAHHVAVISGLKRRDGSAVAQAIRDDIGESASHLVETGFPD